MVVSLGNVPEKLKVVVSRDANFVAGIRRVTGTWAAGVELILDFGNVEWTAEITDALALWAKTPADVNLMLASRPRGVQLWFVDPAGVGARILWASGDLVLKD